jgi:8-oxo-dGTP diphosphatase
MIREHASVPRDPGRAQVQPEEAGPERAGERGAGIGPPVRVPEHRNPKPTVDLVILMPEDRVVLIERRNPPAGWALPGGFVDEGEALDAAAAREAREETGLEVDVVEQFHTYSDPRRDPRGHTVSTVFLGRAVGEPQAGDDARGARAFPWTELPAPIAFDHAEILADVRRYLLTGARRRL